MADVALPVRSLSPDSFAAYGTVIAPPDRDADGSGPGWRWWAETALLDGDERRWGVGYLDLEPVRPARFDWAERHMRTPEVVVPLGGPCLIYVAPAEHRDEPRRLPPLDRFEVFRVPRGLGVVLARGVWHGAPLAADGPTAAMVLILEGTGRNDVTIVRFEDTPVTVDEDASA